MSIKTLLTTIFLSLLFSNQVIAIDKPDKSPFFIKGSIQKQYYDGVTDDLASAGLGLAGLQAVAPDFADPINPTANELRKLAIYNNYRALVDFTNDGGFGRLYGPNIKADGSIGQGLIAGYEYLAFTRKNVTMMLQVPDTFDPSEACIVTAPSSGSRGIYGAIGTAGDWGLKNNCAVVYTDLGKGTGAHNLESNTVSLIDGLRADASVAGDNSHFTASLSDEQRSEFNEEFPNRFAFKHAHSQRNPEKNWGRHVLQSIRFAFYILNQQFASSDNEGKFKKIITPANTIVIASSVSNGGGASVRAAEIDRFGLIDGVAVSEPNVNPKYSPAFTIVQGDQTPLIEHSRSLYDYTTLINVYQSCANLAPENLLAPLNFAPSANACTSLYEKGLLLAETTESQAIEAQKVINDYGIVPEQNIVQPANWFINVPQSISATYANAYGRFDVTRNICGYSFAAINDASSPTAISEAVEKALFSTSNGIPPTAGIQLINNNSLGGAQENRVSVSANGAADQNLDGALCLRSLITGIKTHSGYKTKRRFYKDYIRVNRGIYQVLANGNLHRKPTIFVTGRNDAILPINHTSRAYYGLNQVKEGKYSNMRYYEVKNAHHLDVLNAFAGFNDKFIPLHHYFLKSMDLMFAHLKYGKALPSSQVVRTQARGFDLNGDVPALDESTHLPDIQKQPLSEDKIVFTGKQLRIPE